MLAQRPPSAPKNASGQCQDGSFTTAKTQKGACSQHGGVKTWFNAAATADTAAQVGLEFLIVAAAGDRSIRAAMHRLTAGADAIVTLVH